MNNDAAVLLHNIRWRLGLFMLGLVGVGLSVFPVVTLVAQLQEMSQHYPADNRLVIWINQVYQALQYNQQHYPFLLYSFDWLGFAHLLIALVFVGAWRDPVKNIWVIEFGVLACLLTFPAILIFGLKTAIPVFWWGIDALFGLIGIYLLWQAKRDTQRLIKALDQPS